MRSWWWFTLRFGRTGRIKKCPQRLSETAVWQSLLFEIGRQTDPDSRSICIEGSDAEVGACPTDEKRISVSRAQSTRTNDGDEAACSQLPRSVRRKRLVNEGDDLALGALPHRKPVQLAENWWDAVASPSARHQPSSDYSGMVSGGVPQKFKISLGNFGNRLLVLWDSDNVN